MRQLDKDYVTPEFKKLAEDFGYKQRVGNYYVIREEDGYINISYHINCTDLDEGVSLYKFHKNFYQGTIHKIKWITDISFESENFDEFMNYMCEYHKQKGRELKLTQLNGN